MNAASLLSSQRKKTALNFSQDIINALEQLNFLDVRFEAEFEEKILIQPELTMSGL